MAGKPRGSVTMRVRVGDSEIEVTGPSAFVEKKIAEFLEHHKQAAAAPIGTQRASAGQIAQASPSASRALSPAQFFRKAAPKTDVERVLVAGYYLETIKQQESFTTSDIVETIRAAKVPPPTNPSDCVARNIKKGTMMPSGDKEGRMAFVLTTDGVESVDAALRA